MKKQKCNLKSVESMREYLIAIYPQFKEDILSATFEQLRNTARDVMEHEDYDRRNGLLPL